MSDCTHITVTMADGRVLCDACKREDIPLTISTQGLVNLLRYVKDIIITLEKGGMTDTAKELKERSEDLVINRRLSWKDFS